jgi:peptidoglycan-associated lipoprotein
MNRRTTLVMPIFLVFVAAACAKTPATFGTSTPAPTGQVSSSTVRPVSESRQTRTDSGQSTLRSDTRPPIVEFVPNANLQDIYFDFDKYDIRPDAAKTLDANASWLKGNTRQLLLVEGHCDERGTNEYNLALGERRAKATMNYLVSRGIEARRITVISYGEDRPQCREHTEACWAKNRRARFLVKSE